MILPAVNIDNRISAANDAAAAANDGNILSVLNESSTFLEEIKTIVMSDQTTDLLNLNQKTLDEIKEILAGQLELEKTSNELQRIQIENEENARLEEMLERQRMERRSQREAGLERQSRADLSGSGGGGSFLNMLGLGAVGGAGGALAFGALQGKRIGGLLLRRLLLPLTGLVAAVKFLDLSGLSDSDAIIKMQDLIEEQFGERAKGIFGTATGTLERAGQGALVGGLIGKLLLGARLLSPLGIATTVAGALFDFFDMEKLLEPEIRNQVLDKIEEAFANLVGVAREGGRNVAERLGLQVPGFLALTDEERISASGVEPVSPPVRIIRDSALSAITNPSYGEFLPREVERRLMWNKYINDNPDVDPTPPDGLFAPLGAADEMVIKKYLEITNQSPALLDNIMNPSLRPTPSVDDVATSSGINIEGFYRPKEDGPSRGERLNNPGNMRTGEKPFEGEITSPDEEFRAFESLPLGLRAVDELLQGSRYLGAGKNTIEDIMNVYAPADDGNPTADIVKFVSDETGISPTAQIDLSDPAIRAKLVSAILKRETEFIVTPQEVQRVVGEVNAARQARTDPEQVQQEEPVGYDIDDNPIYQAQLDAMILDDLARERQQDALKSFFDPEFAADMERRQENERLKNAIQESQQRLEEMRNPQSNVQPFVGTNVISDVSKDLNRNSVAFIQPVSNVTNITNNNSTNTSVASGGSRSMGADRTYNIDRSLMNIVNNRTYAV